jgi:hypothetical protein
MNRSVTGRIGRWLSGAAGQVRGEATTDWTFIDRLPDPRVGRDRVRLILPES